jgi:hypothetical protein
MFIEATLTVNYVDNQVVAFLNGEEVYNRTDQEGVQFPDSVELTGKLKAGANALLIVGVNWGGPARFEGSLTVGDERTDWGGQFDTEKLGLIWSKMLNVQGEYADVPLVERAEVGSFRSVPPGLGLRFHSGPDGLGSSTSGDVIKWRGSTFVPCSYKDNRPSSSALVEFDASGNYVRQWEAQGARYIWSITIDYETKLINLHGQGGERATFPWASIV